MLELAASRAADFTAFDHAGHGVPIDTPEAVDWSHTLAPAFHQRKVIQLMDDAHLHLAETLGHLQHEDEENPGPDLEP